MKTVLFTLAVLAAVGTVTVTQKPTTDPATNPAVNAVPVADQVPTNEVEPMPEVKSDLDDLLKLEVEIEQPIVH